MVKPAMPEGRHGLIDESKMELRFHEVKLVGIITTKPIEKS